MADITKQEGKRLAREIGLPEGSVVKKWTTETVRNSHRHYVEFDTADSADHAHTANAESKVCGYGGADNHSHDITSSSYTTKHKHTYSGYTGWTTATDLTHTHSLTADGATLAIVDASQANHTHSLSGDSLSNICGACIVPPPGDLSHYHSTAGVSGSAGAGNHSHSVTGSTGNGTDGDIYNHRHPISRTSTTGGVHSHTYGNLQFSANECGRGSSHNHSTSSFNGGTHIHSVSGDTGYDGEPVIKPTAEMQATTGKTSNAATINGKIFDDGGALCQARFRWAESGVLAPTDNPLTNWELEEGTTLATGWTEWSSGSGSGQSMEIVDAYFGKGQKVTLPDIERTYGFYQRNLAVTATQKVYLAFYVKGDRPNYVFLMNTGGNQSITSSISYTDIGNGWEIGYAEITVSNDGTAGPMLAYDARGGNLSKEGIFDEVWFSDVPFTAADVWRATDWQPETATLKTNDTYDEELTGLTEGTEYVVETQAKNSAGEGDWSASGFFITSQFISAPLVGMSLAPLAATVGAEGYANVSAPVIGQSYTPLVAGVLAKPVAIPQAAANIGQTAARINGKIDDDGGEACDVRFRWRKKELSEEQLSNNSSFSIYSGSCFRHGQKLTIPGRTVTKLSFLVWPYENPEGSLTLTIRDLDDNILASKYWGDASDLAEELDYGWMEVTFETPVFVDEEVRILMESSITTSIPNMVWFRYWGTDIKADENLTDYNGATYVNYDADAAYRYTYAPAWTTLDWDETGYSTDGEFYHDLTDLDDGTEYEFQVQARNTAGEGEWSTSEVFTTLSATQHIVAPIVGLDVSVIVPEVKGTGRADIQAPIVHLSFTVLEGDVRLGILHIHAPVAGMAFNILVPLVAGTGTANREAPVSAMDFSTLVPDVSGFGTVVIDAPVSPLAFTTLVPEVEATGVLNIPAPLLGLDLTILIPGVRGTGYANIAAPLSALDFTIIVGDVEVILPYQLIEAPLVGLGFDFLVGVVSGYGTSDHDAPVSELDFGVLPGIIDQIRVTRWRRARGAHPFFHRENIQKVLIIITPSYDVHIGRDNLSTAGRSNTQSRDIE